MIVPIDGEIDISQAAFVRRAVRNIHQEQPDLVIFEIDTPGGEASSMLAISAQIMGVKGVPAVSFIRPSKGSFQAGAAYSAGALIAISCKSLYMYPGSVIGAAAPIALGGQGAQPLGEKFVSAFRTKFGEVAKTNGYPYNLAIAMVDQDWEVFKVKVDDKYEYLTYYEIQEYERDGKILDVPDTPFVEKGKLLTLGASEAKKCKFAKDVIETRKAIYDDYGIQNPVEIEMSYSWSEYLVDFITHPLMVMILLFVGMIALWATLKAGTIGGITVIGLICFGLLFFGHHLAGLAEITEILLFAGGLVLIALEIFVFPGFGIPGIAGIICVFVGLILSLQDFTWPDPQKAPWQMDQLIWSTTEVLAAFVLATLGFFVLVRLMPGVPFFHRLVLSTELSNAGALRTAEAEQTLLYKHGVTITPLRPAGKMELDGKTMDVVADGDFIGPGEEVQIIQIEGARIVVSKIEKRE